MKRIILCLSLFAFFGSQAQQINPVPDYVFSNKMSVGRNAVTDTAAYFSIGPRYGAIRGMMPPMVTDTASMSATKRNGLLIFSIQKNKYLYWDSVGVKWAEMAGTAGSAITGSGVAGYMPEFTTATNIDTTRLYHSNGRFAIGSTTTTNGVFNVYGGQSYFDTSLKVGSQTLLADEGKNEVYINTTTDAGAYALQVNGDIYNTGGALFAQSSGNVGIGITGPTSKLHVNGTIRGDVLRSNSYAQYEYWYRAFGNISTTNATPANFATTLNGTLYYRLFDVTQQSGLGSAGYVLGIHDDNNGYGYTWQMLSDFSGNIALRAASSSTTWKSPYMIWKDGGNVGIGTTSPSERLHVNGNILTAAPSGGTAKPFKIGEADTVSPTSPNRTIRVEIDGTVYYLHAKTTND